MIDGVKIDVPNLNGRAWLDNGLLAFRTLVDTGTGELLDGTQTAVYRGLTFIITLSKKYPGHYYCSVRGSLHKYRNEGKHNADDFTFEDLQEVINELAAKFSIIPEKCPLRNVEFGVNIQIPIPPKALYKNLITSGKHNFALLKVEGKPLGRCISKQQSTLKIYDKGKQYGYTSRNLIRYELSVNKMAYLKPYGIHTLADLQDFGKVYRLGDILLKQWEDIIYYDKQIKCKLLSGFERKKLLYYAAPRNWDDFNRVQRTRAKQHFARLMDKYGTSTGQEDIKKLIAQKWENLAAQKCTRINHVADGDNSEKMYTNYPLEYTVKMYPNSTSNEEKKKGRFSR